LAATILFNKFDLYLHYSLASHIRDVKGEYQVQGTETHINIIFWNLLIGLNQGRHAEGEHRHHKEHGKTGGQGQLHLYNVNINFGMRHGCYRPAETGHCTRTIGGGRLGSHSQEP
jgi:hypothetical protein